MLIKAASAVGFIAMLSALAQADIREWGGADPGAYEINPALRSILVTADGVFKFESVTDGEFDFINSITVQAGVVGFAGTTEFIAIDYDGYDPNDVWGEGARIIVGGVRYYENDPPARVWEITDCRGDMNNDGITNFGDINAFVDALTDLPDYRLSYPGLEGSMDYHGDANCNGTFGFDDINPFATMVTWECCSIDCTPCGGEGAGGAGGGCLPPEQWAEVLETHVAPESFPGLLDMVSVAAAIGESPADKAYWAEVYDLLTE